MRMESCSLTPPSSPTSKVAKKGDVQDLVNFPVFSCRGELNLHDSPNTCLKGYLKNCELSRILNNDPVSTDSLHNPHKMFGMCLPMSALLTNNNLWLNFRKHLFLLKSGIQEQTIVDHANNSKNFFKLRKEMCSFLHCSKIFLFGLQQTVTEMNRDFLNELVNKFAKEIHGILLFAGRLSDLPEPVVNHSSSKSGNDSSSPSYHLFHFHLELWWSSLEIFYHINQSNWTVNGINFCCHLPSEYTNLFSQLILLIMWDLCYLSSKRYNHISPTDLPKLSPFSCSCIQELWIMIIHLLDSYGNPREKYSFWDYLTYAFNDIMKKENINGGSTSVEFCLVQESFSCTSPYNFCLWLLTNLAPLFKYNLNGDYVFSRKPQSCEALVKKLLEYGLKHNSEPKDDNQLQCLLHFCIQIGKIWDSNAFMLYSLTDYFLKHLNHNFCSAGSGLQCFDILCKSGAIWIDKMSNVIMNFENQSNISSFEMYLYLLKYHLDICKTEGNLNVWKHLRGRIYSKFHPQRMKDITDIGLHNCFSFFLTLAHTADIEEISEKICDLVDMVHSFCTRNNGKSVSLKCLFALVHFHQQLGICASHVTKNLAKHFYNMCLEFSKTSQNNAQRHEYLTLITVYIDGIQDILDKGSLFMLGEHLLIGSGFNILLPACGVSEINCIFYTIGNVLSSVQQSVNSTKMNSEEFFTLHPFHEALLKQLITHILPFIQNNSINRLPLSSSQLADLAAAFTQLSIIVEKHNLNISFSALFNYFGTSSNVNANISCRYMCHLFGQENVVSHIKKCIPNYFFLLIKVWLRCGAFILPPCSQMQELTRLILGMSEQLNCFLEISPFNPVSGNHDFVIIKFLRTLEKRFNSFITVHEKASFRQNVYLFLHDFVTSLCDLVKSKQNIDILKHIYKLTSHLIGYCASLMYVKGKPNCLLPPLLDSFILPHILYSKDKAVSQSLLLCIKENLPLFIQGLSLLDYKTDAYLQRKLRELINQYLFRYSFNNHPILISILDSSTQSDSNPDLLYFATEVIRDSYLIKKGSGLPPHIVSGLSFFAELFQHHLCIEKSKILIMIFPALLEHFLAFDENSIQQNLKIFHQKIFSICQGSCFSDVRHKEFVPMLCTFLEHHLAWNAYRVFKTLEYLASLWPALISDSIPVVAKLVEETEYKRGSGRDPSLRNGLQKIVSQVQKCNSGSKT